MQIHFKSKAKIQGFCQNLQKFTTNAEFIKKFQLFANAKPPNPLRKGGGFITHFVRCGYFAVAQYDGKGLCPCFFGLPRLDFVKARNDECGREFFASLVKKV